MPSQFLQWSFSYPVKDIEPGKISQFIAYLCAYPFQELSAIKGNMHHVVGLFVAELVNVFENEAATQEEKNQVRQYLFDLPQLLKIFPYQIAPMLNSAKLNELFQEIFLLLSQVSKLSKTIELAKHACEFQATDIEVLHDLNLNEINRFIAHLCGQLLQEFSSIRKNRYRIVGLFVAELVDVLKDRNATQEGKDHVRQRLFVLPHLPKIFPCKLSPMMRLAESNGLFWDMFYFLSQISDASKTLELATYACEFQAADIENLLDLFTQIPSIPAKELSLSVSYVAILAKNNALNGKVKTQIIKKVIGKLQGIEGVNLALLLQLMEAILTLAEYDKLDEAINITTVNDFLRKVSTLFRFGEKTRITCKHIAKLFLTIFLLIEKNARFEAGHINRIGVAQLLICTLNFFASMADEGVFNSKEPLKANDINAMLCVLSGDEKSDIKYCNFYLGKIARIANYNALEGMFEFDFVKPALSILERAHTDYLELKYKINILLNIRNLAWADNLEQGIIKNEIITQLFWDINASPDANAEDRIVAITAACDLATLGFLPEAIDAEIISSVFPNSRIAKTVIESKRLKVLTSMRWLTKHKKLTGDVKNIENELKNWRKELAETNSTQLIKGILSNIFHIQHPDANVDKQLCDLLSHNSGGDDAVRGFLSSVLSSDKLRGYARSNQDFFLQVKKVMRSRILHASTKTMALSLFASLTEENNGKATAVSTREVETILNELGEEEAGFSMTLYNAACLAERQPSLLTGVFDSTVISDNFKKIKGDRDGDRYKAREAVGKLSKNKKFKGSFYAKNLIASYTPLMVETAYPSLSADILFMINFFVNQEILGDDLQVTDAICLLKHIMLVRTPAPYYMSVAFSCIGSVTKKGKLSGEFDTLIPFINHMITKFCNPSNTKKKNFFPYAADFLLGLGKLVDNSAFNCDNTHIDHINCLLGEMITKNNFSMRAGVRVLFGVAHSIFRREERPLKTEYLHLLNLTLQKSPQETTQYRQNPHLNRLAIVLEFTQVYYKGDIFIPPHIVQLLKAFSKPESGVIHQKVHRFIADYFKNCLTITIIFEHRASKYSSYFIDTVILVKGQDTVGQKIAIEVDGPVHRNEEITLRTFILKERGYCIVRIKNDTWSQAQTYIEREHLVKELLSPLGLGITKVGPQKITPPLSDHSVLPGSEQGQAVETSSKHYPSLLNYENVHSFFGGVPYTRMGFYAFTGLAMLSTAAWCLSSQTESETPFPLAPS